MLEGSFQQDFKVAWGVTNLRKGLEAAYPPSQYKWEMWKNQNQKIRMEW